MPTLYNKICGLVFVEIQELAMSNGTMDRRLCRQMRTISEMILIVTIVAIDRKKVLNLGKGNPKVVPMLFGLV